MRSPDRCAVIVELLDVRGQITIEADVETVAVVLGIWMAREAS